MYCGNCKHEIVLTIVNIANKKNSFKRRQVVDVRHKGNSWMCLENNCQCIDATGRDYPPANARYPFNKFSKMVKEIVA